MKAVGDEEPLIMKILDSSYLAFKDPHANYERVLAILPDLARALLGDDIPEKVIKLIAGIINLIRCDNDDLKRA